LFGGFLSISAQLLENAQKQDEIFALRRIATAAVIELQSKIVI
jgi:hypothetical protein